MTEKEKNKRLNEALIKAATGYRMEEVTVEYAEVNGDLKVTKRKETQKDVPPDLKAMRLLLGDSETDISQLSDDELETEKSRLMEALRAAESKKKKTKNAQDKKESEAGRCLMKEKGGDNEGI